MELGVRARAQDVAGVPDLVAGLEERDVLADLDDDARGVEAEDPGAVGVAAPADLDVDGVHRHRADLDEEVTGAGDGAGQLDVDLAGRVVDGQAAGEGDGPHRGGGRVVGRGIGVGVSGHASSMRDGY